MLQKFFIFIIFANINLVIASNQWEVNENVDSGCESIVSKYQFRGIIEPDISVSFLEVRAKPSRKDTQWIRIDEGSIPGNFSVWIYGNFDQVIGDPIHLVTQCVHGKWSEKNTFAGNSDGTFVKGNRIWEYSVDRDGSFKVDFFGASTAQYLPGINASPKPYGSSARFLRK